MEDFSTSFNLSSNQNSPDDNSNGTFKLKTNSFYYELGFGIDFYLQYFKFSPSIRGIFSLKDELVEDNDPKARGQEILKRCQLEEYFFLNLSFH